MEMKASLIVKVKTELIKTGLFIDYDSLDDEPFITIYQKKKHVGKIKKSIGSISFNKSGRKITDISFHSLGINAIYFQKYK